MAKKINTKFLVTLFATIVITGAGLSFLVLASKKSPEEHLTLANQLVVEGDYSAALDEFGKAVHKDPENLEASLALLDAIQITPVDRVTVARELAANEWGLRQNLAEFHRDRPEFREQYFQSLFEDLGAPARGYSRLYEAANTRLQNAPNDTLALRFRSIAVAQSPSHYPASNIQSQTTQDLQQMVANAPEDGLVLYSQALWLLHLAERDLRAGSPLELVANQIDDAIEFGKRASSLNDEDVLNARWLTVTLARARSLDPVKYHDPFIQSIANLYNSALNNADRSVRLTDNLYAAQIAKQLLPISSTGNENEKNKDIASLRTEAAIHLLTKMDAAQPANPIILLQLASTQKSNGLIQEAIDTYTTLINLADQPAPAKSFLLANNIASSAIYQQAQLLLSQDLIPEVTDQTLSQQTEAALQKLITAAAGNETGQTLHLRALFAITQNRTDDAVTFFKEAIAASLNLGEETRIKILEDAIAAAASMPSNQGIMRGWLEQALEINPNDILKRFQLTQLNLNAAQRGIPGRDYYGLALKHAQFFSQQERPIHKAIGAWITAQVYASRDQNWLLALNEVSSYELDQLQSFSPRATVTVADWHRKSGNTDQARIILAEYFETNPSDVNAAIQYASLLNSNNERQRVIDKLKIAGLNAEAMTSVQTLILGTDEERRALASESVNQSVGNTTNRRYAEMHAAWSRQDLETTIELADAFITSNPTDQIAWSYKLYALFSQEERPNTQAFAISAAESSGVDEAIWRGRVALFDQEFRRARVLLERGIESAPTNGLARADLGNALIGLNDYEAAIAAFNESLDITGINDGRIALYGLYEANIAAGNNQSALEALRALAQYRLYYTAQEWLQHAEQEDRIGDPQRATTLRENLATLYPQLYSLRRQLALSYAGQSLELKQTNPTEADRLNQKAFTTIKSLIEEQGANTANIITDANITNMLLGNEAAIDTLKKGIENQGPETTHELYLALAEIFLDRNENDKALDAYKSAIRVEPKETLPATRILAYRMLSNTDYEQALTYFDTLAAAFPDDQSITAARIDVLTRLQKFDLAIPLAEQLDPSTAATPITKAKAAISKQDFATAAVTLDEALRNTDDLTNLATSTLLRMRAINRLNLARKDRTPITNLQLDQNRNDLKRALEISPTDWTAQQLLAQNFQQTGEHNLAIDLLESLLQDQPTDSILIQLIQSLNADKQYSRAISLATKASQLSPNEPVWHRQLGQLYMSQGDATLAADSWAVALQTSGSVADLLPASQAFINANQYQLVLDLVDQNPDIFSNSSDLQSMRGQALAMSDSIDAAKQVFLHALTLSSTPDQYLRTTYFITDDKGLGLETGAELLSSDTTQPVAWRAWSIGRAYLRQGKYQEAANTMDDVWPLNDLASPVALSLSQSLGVAYQQLGQAGRSKEAYETALSLDPENPETLNNFAYLLITELNDPTSALPLALKASQLTNGNSPAIQDTLGLVYFNLGQLSEAVATFEPLIENYPDFAVAHHHLGLAYASMGPDNLTRAEVAQQRAIRAAKNNRDTQTQTLAETELNRLRNRDMP